MHVCLTVVTSPYHSGSKSVNTMLIWRAQLYSNNKTCGLEIRAFTNHGMWRKKRKKKIGNQSFVQSYPTLLLSPDTRWLHKRKRPFFRADGCINYSCFLLLWRTCSLRSGCGKIFTHWQVFCHWLPLIKIVRYRIGCCQNVVTLAEQLYWLQYSEHCQTKFQQETKLVA